ncbi:MAG TPA: inositol monophosphatase family protein [Actinomycetota bacterium]|nr:inositol monophosphatase family protein [Actinomycetota bacterium]
MTGTGDAPRDLSREVEAAVDLARLGGRIALGHFRKDPAARVKADGTWVTEADWAAEAQIRLRIARDFPDHNVLGEEEGLTAAGGGDALPDAPTWVIDPIDGTNNFIAGIPIWGTLVALQVDGESVVGAAHAPALGETYRGALGSGAFMNDDAISVSNVDDIAHATVLFGGLKLWPDEARRDAFEDLVRKSWRSRGLGDFWGHMLVARGAAEIMVEPELSLWDVAALQPIVTEAGGRLTHIDGSSWTKKGSCLTTNGLLHTAALETLGS